MDSKDSNKRIKVKESLYPRSDSLSVRTALTIQHSPRLFWDNYSLAHCVGVLPDPSCY